MKKKEIQDARILLKSNQVFNKIISHKVGYFYYFNWQSDQENKLHYCECGHCAFGSGKREDSEQGKNGVWIGPFKDRLIAKEVLKKYIKNIGEVIDCKPCTSDST